MTSEFRKLFQENFEESGRNDNPMEQDYTEKHLRKTRVVFCAKMCMTGRCHDERSRFSCCPILGAERPPLNDRVARSIWQHGLVFWEQLIINHSLDISHQMHSITFFGWRRSSSLETTIDPQDALR